MVIDTVLLKKNGEVVGNITQLREFHNEPRGDVFMWQSIDKSRNFAAEYNAPCVLIVDHLHNFDIEELNGRVFDLRR